MLRTYSIFSLVLRRVNVKATMVELCPGISTASTLSSEPEACGVARFRNEAISTTTTTAAIAIRTIFAGGRFFFAVPYSSPILMVGPAGTAGGAASGAGGCGGGTGVWSGIGFWAILRLRRTGCDPRFRADKGSRLKPQNTLRKRLSTQRKATARSADLQAVPQDHHACFMAFLNACTGSVLSTSFVVSQARRACRTP